MNRDTTCKTNDFDVPQGTISAASGIHLVKDLSHSGAIASAWQHSYWACWTPAIHSRPIQRFPNLFHWLICRANCKTHERRLPSPLRPIFELEFRSMEPPCSSFNPENGLEVGLALIPPEFCNWLFIQHYSSHCRLLPVHPNRVPKHGARDQGETPRRMECQRCRHLCQILFDEELQAVIHSWRSHQAPKRSLAR